MVGLMDFFSPSYDVSYISSQSYFFLFILMCIEGPIVTILAAFAASFGFLNLYIVIVLAFLGDIFGDVFHYYFGRSLRLTGIRKYFKGKSIRRDFALRLESGLNSHLYKTVQLGKVVSPLSSTILVLCGAIKIPFQRFLIVSILSTVPMTAFYVFLGYFFGNAARFISDFISRMEIVLLVTVVFVVVALFVYWFISNKMKGRFFR